MYHLPDWKRTGSWRGVAFVFLCLTAFTNLFAANPDSLLKARIDTLLAHEMPRGAEAGVCIYDLSQGRTLYEHRADKLSRPASTMKLMTAITALATPDANRPFRTRLCTDGTQQGDTLKGNLYAVGDMDPEFDEDAMEQLVAGLKERGVRVIDGDIVGDVSLKDSLYWGEGWLWDDAPAAYQPYMSPLMLNKGALQISIRPDEAGFPAFVRGYPASTYYLLDNRTRSRSSGAGPLKVSRDWMHHSNVITLTGNVSRSEGREMSLFDSGSFFLHVLTEKLMRAGIRCTAVTDSTREGIRAAYRFGQLPDSAVVELAVYETSFQAVLDEMLKESDNLNAEAVLCRTGAQAMHKKKVSADDGLDVMRKLIRQAGLNPKRYSLADGCGLSHYDYLSPELLVAVLKYAYARTELFAPLYRALPVSGVDGTLKYRMGYGTPGFKRVHAKTGSYTGVNCLAGYLQTKSGHWVAFAIMVQNALSARAARALQDAICLEVIQAQTTR